MGVAQRYGKVMVQSSMGIPKLQTYDRAFPATPFGPEPDKTYPNVILDMMASMPTPPKTMVVLTSKVPLGAVHGAGHAAIRPRSAASRCCSISNTNPAIVISAPLPRA